MEAVVFIILQVFFGSRALLKIGVYLTIVPWARVKYEMIDSQRGATNDPVFNNLGYSPVLAGEYSVTKRV